MRMEVRWVALRFYLTTDKGFIDSNGRATGHLFAKYLTKLYPILPVVHSRQVNFLILTPLNSHFSHPGLWLDS